MHNPVSCRKTPLLKRKENAFVPKEGSQLLNIQEVKYVGTNRERERGTQDGRRGGVKDFFLCENEREEEEYVTGVEMKT